MPLCLIYRRFEILTTAARGDAWCHRGEIERSVHLEDQEPVGLMNARKNFGGGNKGMKVNEVLFDRTRRSAAQNRLVNRAIQEVWPSILANFSLADHLRPSKIISPTGS